MLHASPELIDSSAGIRGEKIAIVDDNEEFCSIISKIMEVNGFRPPIVAYDGDQIVDAVVNNSASPDVIVMDYIMPGKNGAEAARIISQKRPEIQIIFASSREEAKEAAQKGGFRFIKKPFSFRALVEMLS
ncbi:MAG: response regulator [Nitrososphaerales archaeon]